jgi:glycosyltransferase involved in cell wall biosynthesis
MITYNHAAYIRQAVESVLCQRTDFPFEVVIGDDCSTDETPKILRTLLTEYPHLLRVLAHTNNLGSMGKPNLVSVIEASRGTHLAFLEGDDFWNEPGKLSEQVRFLDREPQCSGVCHDASVLHPNGQRGIYPFRYPPDCTRIGPTELLTYGFPHTTTLMFRRDRLLPLPEWFHEMSMGDWPMTLKTSMSGPIGYLRDQWWSTHRSGVGYWQGRSLVERTRQEMRALETFGRVLGGAQTGLIQRGLNRRHYYLAEGFIDLGQLANARAEFLQFLAGWPRHRSETVRRTISLALRLYVPRLRRAARTLAGKR